MNTRKTLVALMGAVTLVAVIIGAALVVIASNPRVEGQTDAQAASPVTLDLKKRYDVYCRLGGGRVHAAADEEAGERFFPSMRFVGYLSDPLVARGSGKRGDYDAFDHWLVLEYVDGRRVCIPPGSVEYFEETTSPTEAPPAPTPAEAAPPAR